MRPQAFEHERRTPRAGVFARAEFHGAGDGLGPVVAVGVAKVGRNPDLSHAKAATLSVSADGNHHAIASRAAAAAQRKRGRIDNVTSTSRVENVERLFRTFRSPRFVVIVMSADDVVGRIETHLDNQPSTG